jgi:predicted dehydrogenase
MGEKGSVEISGFAVNKIRHFNFVSPSDEDAEIMTRFSENPPNVYGYGHVAYLQNVIDALKSRAKPLVDGMEGRKSLELIHALYLSAETGKEIHVPTNHQQSRLGKGL